MPHPLMETDKPGRSEHFEPDVRPWAMTKTASRPLLLIASVALFAVACTGAVPNPSASPTPTSTPTPAPTGSPTETHINGVSSAAQAAAVVFASNPLWAGMAPLRPDIIGASSWYEAFEEAGGYGVVITVGSGDCQAGCIDQHRWIYHVDPNAEVTLVREEGDPVDMVTPPAGTTDPAHLTIVLSAGPVCPVEQNPPDPNCADRAVKNAIVILYDANGTQVATDTSDDSGQVTFEVTAGAYYVVVEPVAGLMGTPDAQAFAVLGGDSVQLAFAYDTGIR